MTDRIRTWALALILAAGMLGNGGSAPAVLLLVHLAVATLVAWELLAGRRGAPIAPAIRLPLSGFIVLALLGGAFAPYRYGAILTLLELAVFLAVAWLASLSGARLLDRLAVLLPAAALIQVGVVLSRRLFLDEWRSAGTFFNPNHLAAWLVAALLILAGSVERRLPFRIGAGLALFAGLVLSGSRGGLVGLAAGGMYLLALAWSRLGRRERLLLAAAVAAAGIMVAGAMAKRFSGPDRFAMHRTGIWAGTAAMIGEHPWSGVGPGQFDWNARRYQFPDGEGVLSYDHLYSNSHSDWLRLPAEYGLPAACLAALSMGGVAATIRRRRRTGGLPPRSAGAVAALLALLAQSAFQNLSHSPAVYLTAAALIGALVGRKGTPSEQGRPNRSSGVPFRPTQFLACVLLLVTFLVADGGPYLAYRLTDGAAEPPGRDGLRQAARLNRLQPYIRMGLAESFLADGPLTPQAYRSARFHAEEAVRLHPGDATLRRRLARVEARGCRELFRDSASRSRALGHYLAAEGLAPAMAMIPLETGDFLLSVSDPGGAVAAADRALSLEPGAIPPRLLKGAALLDRDGAAALTAARRLMEESLDLEQAAEAARKESEYARVLLAVDPERKAALAGRIREHTR